MDCILRGYQFATECGMPLAIAILRTVTTCEEVHRNNRFQLVMPHAAKFRNKKTGKLSAGMFVTRTPLPLRTVRIPPRVTLWKLNVPC